MLLSVSLRELIMVSYLSISRYYQILLKHEHLLRVDGLLMSPNPLLQRHFLREKLLQMLFVFNYHLAAVSQIIQLLHCPDAVPIHVKAVAFLRFFVLIFFAEAHTFLIAKNVEQNASINHIYVEKKKDPNQQPHTK